MKNREYLKTILKEIKNLNSSELLVLSNHVDQRIISTRQDDMDESWRIIEEIEREKNEKKEI